MRKGEAINPNQKGYTLLSMMIALAAFTMITSIIANAAAAALEKHHYAPLNRKDIWLFFEQIQTEIASGENIHISESSITFTLNNKMINYKLLGTNIIRTVDSQGYEMVLQNIQSLSFQYNGQYNAIEINDTHGRKYQWEVKNMVQ